MPSNRTGFQSKNRVLQKSYTQGEHGLPVVGRVAELAHNAIALYPDIPATHFSPLIIELAEPELLAALDELLRVKYLVQIIRTLRRAESREPVASWLFPEIEAYAENIPKRVHLGNGRTIERPNLCYKHLGIRLKLLNKRHRENKEVTAITALMELWPALTPKTQGLTLAEVDAMKARAAGLV